MCRSSCSAGDAGGERVSAAVISIAFSGAAMHHSDASFANRVGDETLLAGRCPPTDGSIDRSVGRLVAWLIGCLVAWLLASCCRALAFADTPRRDYTHWIPQITTALIFDRGVKFSRSNCPKLASSSVKFWFRSLHSLIKTYSVWLIGLKLIKVTQNELMCGK